MNILEIKSLFKTYKSGEDVRAVNGVSFNVSKGELISIMGQSGSGKSTLMHLIGGVDTATSGDVFIDGTNIIALNEEERAIFRRKNIGIIYQFFNLIDNMTVKKNIILPVMLDEGEVDKEFFDEITELLELSDKLDRFPKQLSGGQQQRVAIARSLMAKPKVILADEPTGNLDHKNSLEFMELLKVVNRKFNTTIIIITHDREIASLCDRSFTMCDGNIREE